MELEMIERRFDLQIKEAVLYGECAIYEYDLLMNDKLMYENQGTRPSLFERIRETVSKIFAALKRFVVNIVIKINPFNQTKTMIKEIDNILKMIQGATPDTEGLYDLKTKQHKYIDVGTLVNMLAHYDNLIKKYTHLLESGTPLSESDRVMLNNVKESLKAPPSKMMMFKDAAAKYKHYAPELISYFTADNVSKKHEKYNRILDNLEVTLRKSGKVNDATISRCLSDAAFLSSHSAYLTKEYYNVVNSMRNDINQALMDASIEIGSAQLNKMQDVAFKYLDSIDLDHFFNRI